MLPSVHLSKKEKKRLTRIFYIYFGTQVHGILWIEKIFMEINHDDTTETF